MTKAIFQKYVKTGFTGLSIEKQLAFLENVSEWIKEMRQVFLKDKFYCYNCKKYSLSKKVKQIEEVEMRYAETVSTDCGYGDFDELADVSYLVTYEICPICGEKKEKKKKFINEKNRRYRGG